MAAVNCVVCDSENNHHLLIKNSFEIFECLNCNAFFVYPRASEEELRLIYSFSKGYFKNNRFDPNAAIDDLTKKKIKWLTDSSGNMLDVGCGTGSYMHWCKAEGVECTGIDVNPDIVEYCIKKGLDVRNSTLEKFEGPPGFYDAINLGDIVEHVLDPISFLKQCNNLLKSGGKMVITTPNKNCFFSNYQLFIGKWFGIPSGHLTPPYHLTEFSDINLEKLLDDCGYKVNEIHYSSISLFYSIHATGLISEDLRAMLQFKLNIKNLSFSLLKSIIQVFTATLLYTLGFFLASLINLFRKRKNSMTFFCNKYKSTTIDY